MAPHAVLRPALLPHTKRFLLCERRISSITASLSWLPKSHRSPSTLGFRRRGLEDAPAVPRLLEEDRLLLTRTRSSSSTAASPDGSSFFTSPLSWWRGRQEKKEEDKYRERIAYMASKDAWTIGDMWAELDEVVSSWKSKIPRLSDNKETKMAQKMHKAVSGIIDVVGKGATDAELDAMTRKQKLESALKGETTVEEINILTKQFQTMALMHRVLRKRTLEGKPIPSSSAGMQSLLQAEGPKSLSKTQRERMKSNQMRMMRKSPQRR